MLGLESEGKLQTRLICLFMSAVEGVFLSVGGLVSVQMQPGNDLDEACRRAEIVAMRAGKSLVVIAILAVQAIAVLGASYASYPNPVGEAAYRPHLLRDMLPFAVIVCALLLGWLLHAAHRKAKRLVTNNVRSHLD